MTSRSPLASRLLLLALSAALALAGAARRSAAKPPPGGGDDSATPVTPGGPKARPPTGQGIDDALLQGPSDEEVATFTKAYKKLGRPSIVVICGIDARIAGAVGVGTQGVPMGRPDATGGGAVVLDTDPTGFSEQFAANLTEPLNPDGRVKFKDMNLLRAKVEEMKASLKTAGEDEALDVLGKSLGVDMIFYAKFTPRTAAQVAADGRPFAATMSIKRTGDAGVISLGAFDVDRPLDNTGARIYANVINKDLLIPKFGKMDAGRDIELDVLGVNTVPQASQLRKIIAKLDDVDGDVEQKLEKTDAGEDYASYAFSITSTHVEDLLDGFRDGVKEKLHTDLTVIKQGSHTIMVRLEMPGGTAAPAWYAITETDKPSDPHDALVARLKDSPKRVAVVVNWMVENNQLGWNDYWYRGSTLTPEVGAPQVNNKMIGTQSEELDRLQNNISDWLNKAGGGQFVVVDRSAVDAAVQAEVAKATSHHSSEEVIAGLKNSVKCDLILWGKARLVSEAEVAEHRRAKMTFSLYDPATGRFLGSVNWNGERNSLSKQEQHGIPRTFFDEDKDPDGRNVARYVCGTVLAKWMDAKPMVDVEVRGARDVAQVQALADSLDKSVDDLGVFGIRYDDGTGTFTVSYAGSTDELEAKIRAKAAALPDAAKLTEATANKLVFQYSK